MIGKHHAEALDINQLKEKISLGPKHSLSSLSAMVKTNIIHIP